MAQLTKLSLDKFIQDLASDKPAPGGGSAAALSGSMGVSLVLMVSKINARRFKTKKEISKAKRLTEAAKKLLPQFQQIINDDAKIYTKVSKKYKTYFSSKSEGKKTAARILLDQALVEAFQVQATLALLSVMALRVNKELFSIASGAIKNDLNVSKSLLNACYEGAYATCEVNYDCVKDKEYKKHLKEELKSLKNEIKII